ncbi:MAG: sigma-54-dependent Fis family transcriptional regulator [Magnetococcales bacterium]|nr:sigma-54-dependent Fis family transcriptional regulator [Magnetococcales bacterium]
MTLDAAHPPIVLVDDEPSLLLTSKALLRTNGLDHVVTLEDSRQLLPFLQQHDAAVIILDLMMPHLSGMQLLPEIKRHFPHIPVIIMTAAQELDTAIECMRQGALDYLVKPVEESHFIANIKRALDMNAMKRHIQHLKNSLLAGQPRQEKAFAALVTRSPKMRAIFQYAEAIAASREPVIITGETGTGKDLLAQAIHDLSGRKGKLVAVNIAGLDDHLLSDTLFGHKRGAFSGAETAREGMIAQADGGTLFLDEIGDLSPTSQVKLLRLLQEGSYFPLGSDNPRHSNARVLCATNRDLDQIMRAGLFRQDFYYRLSTHRVHMPPLRERYEDIPLLLARFIEESAQAMGKPVPVPPPELTHRLSSYPFPGNIRELKAMVADAVAQSSAPILATSRFDQVVAAPSTDWSPEQTLPHDMMTDLASLSPLPTLQAWSDRLIQEALRRSGGNQRMAATLLGISRHTIMRWEQAQRGRSGSA